ncbi:MAG: BTAD domain-containing putative transcriptional regulator [Acidimicrobiales bacterium]
MLHIRLLGPPEVTDDQGRDVLPPGAREQLCLAILAVVAPTGLSTPRLAAELYTDRETSDPRNAVQAVVSRLRRALGRSAGCVETTSNGYRLVDVSLDVDQAEELLRRAASEPDPVAARAVLAEADALWRGPTLDGLGPAAALDAERLRIDGLRADAVDAVAARALETGAATSELVATLEAATRAEPLRERRWELLMTALYRQGRQAEALRAFQQARRHLSDELGLSPGPALVDLERRILIQDPALAGAGGEPEAGTQPQGVLSLVLGAGDEPAVFAEPAQALAAAVDAARATGARAAVHTGVLRPAAASSGDGDGYRRRNPVADLARRLLDIAHDGQVLASSATVDLARPDLAADIELRDLGLHWLVDAPEPVAVWQVSGPGLRTVFPPLRTAGPASLPRLRSPLLGRDPLVAEIVDLVGRHPLVSLVGPGGIGKTSLSLAVAWAVAGGRPVVFVDLATTTDPAAVGNRLAQEVAPADIDDERTPERRLADHLRVSTDLVVVDNAEHVLDAVAAVLEPVLADELKGSLLVTSRQPLGLAGEAIVGIPPLALPDQDADLSATGESPSVQLFLARARAARHDVAVPPGLLPVVAHICRRLDGIPLAIELAAGRASLLSVEDIAARVDDQLRLLRQVRSSRERRHRSLEAVVGWSVDQLTPPARQLFARLAVMSGEFDLLGAEALVERCGLSSIDVLECLDELHDASLLAVSGAGGAGSARFRMLEPIRQLAEAELTAAGLMAETRRAHARWLIGIVSDAHARRDDSRPAAFAAVDRYGSQLRAAIAWITETAQLDLAEEIALGAAWWFLLNDARAGRDLMTTLMGLADREREPLRWAVLVVARAMAKVDHSDRAIAEPVLQAVEVLDAHDHPDADVARVVAAFTQLAGSDLRIPYQLLQEADALTEGGGTWSRAVVDMAIMILDGIRYGLEPTAADPAVALARGHRAAEAFRAMSEHWALGVTLSELGRLHQQLGDDERAEACYLEAVELLGGGEHHVIHFLYSCLGRLATGRGDHERALAYHRQALAIAEVDANPGCIAITQAGLGHAAEARGDRIEARDRYRLALSTTDDLSILEYGQDEWRDALARLEDAPSP